MPKKHHQKEYFSVYTLYFNREFLKDPSQIYHPNIEVQLLYNYSKNVTLQTLIFQKKVPLEGCNGGSQQHDLSSITFFVLQSAWQHLTKS